MCQRALKSFAQQERKQLTGQYGRPSGTSQPQTQYIHPASMVERVSEPAHFTGSDTVIQTQTGKPATDHTHLYAIFSESLFFFLKTKASFWERDRIPQQQTGKGSKCGKHLGWRLKLGHL